MTEVAPLAPSQIFKAYDIRGLYGEEMDETTALAVLAWMREPALAARSHRTTCLDAKHRPCAASSQVSCGSASDGTCD